VSHEISNQKAETIQYPTLDQPLRNADCDWHLGATYVGFSARWQCYLKPHKCAPS